MLYNFVPSGRGEDIIKNGFTPEEREELLKTLYHRNKETSVELLSTAPQLARIAFQEEYKE